MFSARTAFEARHDVVAEAVADRLRRGLPVLDLTESNPTRVGLAFPADELLSALHAPAALVYDPEPFGLRTAREAVARRYPGVDADDIVLSASTSEAYANLFRLLCDPGERVLVAAPSYPLFDLLARLESVELDTVATHAHDAFFLDASAVEQALTPRTRALVVVSPNNPTGRVLRRGELEALVRLCADRGLALIVDEVFADWIDTTDPDAVRTAVGIDGCLAFVLGGLSKSCLLPQLKLAWTVVRGPVAQRRNALARLDVIADTALSVNGPVQHALPQLLALGDTIRAPLRTRLAANRRALVDAARDTSVTVLPADGGWSALLSVPRLHSEDAWARALAEEEGLVVHPGWFFGGEERGWLVVNLLQPEPVFAHAAMRLATFVEGRCWSC